MQLKLNELSNMGSLKCITIYITGVGLHIASFKLTKLLNIRSGLGLSIFLTKIIINVLFYLFESAEVSKEVPPL